MKGQRGAALAGKERAGGRAMAAAAAPARPSLPRGLIQTGPSG